MTTWHEHAIFWHVYPLGFVGAEAVREPGGELHHRLGRITGWLDHAVELGASALLLGPVFASASHGYDTTDHLTIDPRLGDRADFDALVAAAHARGLRVVLDGVFNHVGSAHPTFRAALEGGPGSAEASMFRISWPDGPDASPVYDTFEGHEALVALNHDDERVVELVTDVMLHWLRAGADGWRLDAAYAVPPSFWARVLPAVRAQFPDVYVVGEVIHGDYAGIVAESGMDAVTQYELWKAVWSSLEDHNFHELAHALGRHGEMLETFAPMTFVGNHDVTRIATRVQDPRHLAHAVVVLFTVGGAPSVYAGDEYAFQGLKEERLGGDDAIRPEFPDRPEDLVAPNEGIFRLHQELIALRRRHPWLHRARTTMLEVTNETVSYEATADGERLVVALSTADSRATVPVGPATAVVSGSAHPLGDGRAELPPHGWAVLA